MSSAICFNLDQSKILSPGNGLTLYHTIKILDWSKLKPFTDDKIYVTKELKFVLGKEENIVRQGENADCQHFLLLPQCFEKYSFSDCGKGLMPIT